MDDIIVFDPDEEFIESQRKKSNSITSTGDDNFFIFEFEEEPKLNDLKMKIIRQESSNVDEQSVSPKSTKIQSPVQKPTSYRMLPKTASTIESNFDKVQVYKPKLGLMSTSCTFVVERLLFFPQKFHLYNSNKHVLTARRKIMQTNSLFYFFTSPTNLSTKDQDYVGYMEANFNGTEYNIFTKDSVNIAHITFNIQQDVPTQIELYISNTDDFDCTLIKTKLGNKWNHILELSNKKPVFNKTTNSYTLNMMGKAKCASKKNCIIEFKHQNSLLLAKQKEKNYLLQYGHPFNDMTAFGFTIAHYEQKLGDPSQN